MKIIRNNIIPFKGFKAINLFGILFVRGNAELSDEVINHESIHTAQMKEMLYIPFYIWYGIEYLCKRWNYTAKEAYRAISFEREAYNNQDNLKNVSVIHGLTYLIRRNNYGLWWKEIRWQKR